uniref:Peptidase S1 domain-containing protein n=1 Tax=Timema douglasi TaxID=61478 RepID=A0A7R8VD95_TIMDO|nr:unnamed protein product [Timema douglasi]
MIRLYVGIGDLITTIRNRLPNIESLNAVNTHMRDLMSEDIKGVFLRPNRKLPGSSSIETEPVFVYTDIISPLLLGDSGVKEVGKQALQTGSHILADIATKEPGQEVVVECKPITFVDNDAQLDFFCPGDGEYYRDLSSIKLYLRIQLVKWDGTVVGAVNKIVCVNNLLNSLFSQINISLNETPITTSTDNYAYRAYLETLTIYVQDASDTHLVNGMWFLDTPAPTSCIHREQRLRQEIRLVKTSGRLDAYNLNTDVRLKILDATLFVKHVEVSPTISLAIEKTLLRKPAQYHLNQVKSVTIPKGSKYVSLNNVIQGVIPKIVLFTMVSNDAFVGSLNTNSFQLIHRNLDRFVLYVNGIKKHLPILINFDNVGTSTLTYNTLFSGLDIHHQNNGHLITRDMFNKGYFILAFDLTPDSAGQDSHTSLQTEGNVRFELQFKTYLDTAITSLFYSEYEETVSIDYNWEKRLQAIASGVCGHYCCLFAVAKDAGWSLRRFTDLFSTADLCKNDRLAVTLFKLGFGRCPRCTSSGAQTCVPSLDIKGLFVIMGVGSCGSGTGYCLLGIDCTMDKDFLPDDDGGHCDGLRSAFTPSANFICCRYATGNATTDPIEGEGTLVTSMEEGGPQTESQSDINDHVPMGGNYTGLSNDMISPGQDMNETSLVEDPEDETIVIEENEMLSLEHIENVTNALETPEFETIFAEESDGINLEHSKNETNLVGDPENEFLLTEESDTMNTEHTKNETNIVEDPEYETVLTEEKVTTNIEQTKNETNLLEDPENETVFTVENYQITIEHVNNITNPKNGTFAEEITPVNRPVHQVDEPTTQKAEDNSFPMDSLNTLHSYATTINIYLNSPESTTYKQKEIITDNSDTESITESQGTMIIKLPEIDTQKLIEITKVDSSPLLNSSSDLFKASTELSNSVEMMDPSDEISINEVSDDQGPMGNTIHKDSNEHLFMSGELNPSGSLKITTPYSNDGMKTKETSLLGSTVGVHTATEQDNQIITLKYDVETNKYPAPDSVTSSNCSQSTERTDVLEKLGENDVTKRPDAVGHLDKQTATPFNPMNLVLTEHNIMDIEMLVSKNNVSKEPIVWSDKVDTSADSIKSITSMEDIDDLGAVEAVPPMMSTSSISNVPGQVEEESDVCQGSKGDLCWLVKFVDPTKGSVLCFGSSLDADTILTSARCITRIFTAGLRKVTLVGHAPEMSLAMIRDVAVHEEYRVDGPLEVLNDIGVVRLVPDVSRSYSKCFLCLPHPGDDFSGQPCSSPVIDNDNQSGRRMSRQLSHECGRETNSPLGIQCHVNDTRSRRFVKDNSPEVAGSPLLCGSVLAGVASPTQSGTMYTPVSDHLDWIATNRA